MKVILLLLAETETTLRNRFSELEKNGTRSKLVLRANRSVMKPLFSVSNPFTFGAVVAQLDCAVWMNEIKTYKNRIEVNGWLAGTRKPA